MEKEKLKEYFLSNNKKVILASDVKEKIDTYNFNQLIDMRITYSNLPFSILEKQIYIDIVCLKNMTDLIAYIDDRLITFSEFKVYINNIKLNNIKSRINNYLEDYYCNKFYYKTLSDDINDYTLTNNCNEIISYLDSLIEKNTIKENMHEYILSNNKKVYILPSIKEEIDKFDYNKLLNRRKLYSNMPFCNFSEKDIIDKVKNIISYIDDKLISYKEFYNYLDNINLDFTSEKKMYDNNLEFLYTNKLYYETLRDNINNDSLIKNCNKIIICIDKLIKKINN